MKKKDNYVKILEISYKMFAKLGYERTSISLIAEEMGFSKPALYNYFKSKEAIFEMLYGVIIDEIVNTYKVVNSVKDYKAYLIDIGHETIDSLKEKPEFPGLLMQFFLLGLRNESIGNLTKKLEKETKKHFEKLVALGIKSNCINSNDKAIYVEMILMMDQGILEKVPYLDESMLKEIWSTFINKLLS